MDRLGVLGHWQMFCLVIILHIKRGYLMTMITDSQRYILNKGETVVLFCDFHAQHYNLFDYPVLWWKYQHEEKIQINVMGNLNEPFVHTGRFKVNFSQDPPIHRLELIIRDVISEDSGNYTCEVRGLSSVVLSSVTHYVYIREPIMSMMLATINYTEDEMVHKASKHSRKVTMIEKSLNHLSCTAQGGYPAPDIYIKLGNLDITPQFYLTITPVLTGQLGLRKITYTTELSTDSFIPSSDDDWIQLRCIASVSGYKSYTTALRLDIFYSPKILCHSLSVFEGDRNAMLRCEIWSKPQVHNVFWIIDDNGTTLSEGESISGFWIVVQANTDDTHQEVNLYIRQVRPESFRTYTIVAENSIAASNSNVALYRKKRPTPRHKSQSDRSKKIDHPSQQSVPSAGSVYTSSTARAQYMQSSILGLYIMIGYVQWN